MPQTKLHEVQQEMGKVIVGQHKLINRLLVAILAKGHILLEGVPGLAKTTAIATLAKIIKLDFQRIQFTPDLLPSDLIGTRIFNPKDLSFSIKKGPIFGNFILADEINRSPAKVQSALLEAMQEKQVTIGEETFALPSPFFVMATQNPIEQEGTFPLPEAQVDRFLLKVTLDYPTEAEEIEIMTRAENSEVVKLKTILNGKDLIALQEQVNKVFLDDSLKNYIKDLVFATRNPKESLKDLIAFGASPRASLGLMQAAKAYAFLEGRDHVIPEDIKAIALDVLRHRVTASYEAEAEGITSDALVKEILNSVKVP